MAKTMKELLEEKIRELEDIKKRLPSYKDRECGVIKHNDSVELWERIEELEEEIARLKDKVENG